MDTQMNGEEATQDVQTPGMSEPLRSMTGNHTSPFSAFNDRQIDDSLVSSESDDAEEELEEDLGLEQGNFGARRRSRRQLMLFKKFEQQIESGSELADEAEEEDEEEDQMPWNLEQMSLDELKGLAKELEQRTMEKREIYPDKIRQNTEIDLGNLIRLCRSRFNGLVELLKNLESDEMSGDDSNDEETHEEISSELNKIENLQKELNKGIERVNAKKQEFAALFVQMQNRPFV